MGDSTGAPLKPTVSHQISASLLRRAGSTIPRSIHRDHSDESAPGLAPPASKWFKRGRLRPGRHQQTASNGYQLDMNFSDLGNFVDLSRVRRPSATSSLGTGESASLNAGNAAGDSSGKDGDSNPSLVLPDNASGYTADRRRLHGSSSPGPRRSNVTQGSPSLKEAIAADVRSIASSLRGSKARGSSAGPTLGSEAVAPQRTELQAWPSNHSWQQRESSVKSRRPTTLFGDIESECEHEYSGSVGDHGSVQSAPTFEDKHPLMQFTDPWSADRDRHLPVNLPSTDRRPSATNNGPGSSTNSLRGTPVLSEQRDIELKGHVDGVIDPDILPRKSEPWAPPESWAVLPTTLDGTDEGGVAVSGVKDPVSDGEGVSSDSDLEGDNNLYSLRIYKEDSTFGTFHCRLSTTTAEFMQMAAKKFFIPDITRHCLYMQKANGLDRTLNPTERPANILKKYLEQMGYRPEDNITLQGREDNSYLCKFSLFKAAIPRVSPNMEVEVSSFHYVELRARKLQTVPVFLYAHANKIVSLNMSKNPGLNFPADFVQLCGNLRELRLSTCQFSRFPTSIQYFPHLTFLDLSGNDMKRMRHAPLYKLVHLTTLMLRNNRLVDLPESLAELRSLQVLNVSNNNLPAFPLVVTKIASLVDLDISLNRIPDIPNSISSLVNLVKLNVMGNSLTGNLPEGLGRLSKLEELDVRQNKLQDFGVTAKLAVLKLLYTESNIVTRAHMELTSAVSVSLRSNKLTQCHLTNPAHTLVFLDLSRNQLTELPPDTFVHLPMLEHLVLDSNHIVSIPPSVGNLSNLVRLSCANNILSLIPIELTRLEKLTTLDLHNNNLKLLPPEIWLMPKLAVLSLSSNLLEQFPHPSMLENLRRQQGGSSSVRAVAAAAAAAAAAAQRSGAIKGSVASRVAQSIQLSAVSASSSRQTSPQVRANSESISDYADQHGDLALPVGAERMRNKSADAGRLQTLTPTPPIKRYTVSDPPPLSLSLKELRMGDNNLDDEVFTLMAFLPELRVLNLSYNELYDLPPSAMAHMRKITELYLSGTQISTIPEEEPNAAFWRSLRLLNINGNKLQTLPSWLAKIHGLSVLDVGSNVLKYNITNWPYDWNWNWNTSLKYLNFSYNERFEIKGAHLHTKVFHDHAKLVSNTQSSGPARDLFNYISKEPPKSDCVSDFYQLNDLRILGLLQLTIMVPLPDETQNRRVRTTDPIKQVKYGIADTLGREDRVSAWDLATSRFRMVDEECLFGLFHARETGTSSSAISKYLCDNFLYVFREELEKVTEQMHSDEHDSRSYRGSGYEAKKTVNFAESSGAAEENHASHLNNEQVQAALRRTFLTLNKDLGTHNRQLIAAAAAAEAYAARSARVSTPSAFGDNSVDGSGPAASRLAVPEFNAPGRGSFDPKAADSVSGDHQGGTTAVVAYIHGRMLHVSNVGDALGVVSRRGTPVMLSKRHDSYDVDEIMRIRSIGGYITQQGKVQGQTDITRAFGYFHLLPYVNADPTINSIELTEEDEFLILANRPVWDAITPQIAVDIARKHRRDPRLAAARVRDHVIAYGVTNSIMVMVIGFGPMFSKNTGRPMRGFSVRDSIYPGVSDHRAKYALTRRLSRSPSTTISPTFGKHTVALPSSDKVPVHVAPGSQQNYPPIPTQHGPYELDDLDDFLGGHSSRARRQRDRDVNARPGDSTLARLEREVPPPVGEIALVFTDVKNSTIQWETNQVAMRSAIKVHNSTMRRMLRSIGGYEVKTEGDAFIVSFPTVASALHWCLAVQMAFLAADWPQETLDSPHGCPLYWPNDDENGVKGIGDVEKRRLIYRGLRVRMGVHFGSPVSEEDPVTRRMDYFGPMVNRSARISGAADGGQVYVSQDVMDEVYAILGIFETADLGGITDMHQIIDEPSLARDVQALKTLGLCATPIGEIKLKGLESPEFVSMVYPAALRGRIDMQVQEEERQQLQKQQEIQQQQQQQQQQLKRKKQEWSRRESPASISKSPNQRKTPISDSLIPYHNGQSQRSSIDEGMQYMDSTSLGSLSALSSQRSSFSRQPPTQVQRNMRELSMEISTAGGAEIRNRLRQVGDMPLWSAPVTRRSVSLLQNHVTGPEHLESIVEDSALYRIPDVGTQSMGRGSRDRPRPSVNLSSPRTPMYMPAYYAYLQGVSSSGWSRQGSSYFTGSVNATGSQGPGTIQASRSSIDAGTGSLWTGDVPEQVKTIDPLHVDMLYRLLYRLGILAVESDTEAVLPSFEYFVAHQDDDLSSYRIHRASTVSIGSIQHHGARCQQPQNGGMP
ncbi:cysteinyl-tRNA synthetase, partial [Coemansia sp. RSA 922]